MSFKNLILSVAFHAVILLLSVIGITAIPEQPTADVPIFFEMVEIKDVSEDKNFESSNRQIESAERLGTTKLDADIGQTTTIIKNNSVVQGQDVSDIRPEVGRPMTVDNQDASTCVSPINSIQDNNLNETILEQEKNALLPISPAETIERHRPELRDIKNDSHYDNSSQMPEKSRIRVVAEPKAKNRIIPAYPRSARRRNREGCVSVKAHIANDGTVTKTEVVSSSGHDDLDRAAAKAVETAEFIPAEEDGQTTAGELLLVFEFRLK